jgi:uncharacterized membrane protein YeaQ/YmgE (transglycosylase-associated protein family)
MSIIGWIILGLIAGYIASKIVDRTGKGFVVDILLGIDGAVVGGWLFHGFGMRGVNGVNPYSFLLSRSGDRGPGRVSCAVPTPLALLPGAA